MNMARSAPLMRLLLLLTVCLGLAGCKSQCRQLSERLCECSLNSTERSNCVANAGTKEASNAATPQEEDVCRAKLQPGLPTSCDCHLIETAAGKIRCGLARDPNPPLDGGP